MKRDFLKIKNKEKTIKIKCKCTVMPVIQKKPKHLRGSAMAKPGSPGKHNIINYCSSMLRELKRPFYSGVQEN